MNEINSAIAGVWRDSTPETIREDTAKLLKLYDAKESRLASEVFGISNAICHPAISTIS